MVLPYWPLQTPRPLPTVLPDWPLETLQNLALARLWALGSVRWPSETLQNLALARLWALGSVRDCGRSCADCGVGALARQILGSAILAVGDARCSEPEFAQEMKENERKVFFLGIQRERLAAKPLKPLKPFKPLKPLNPSNPSNLANGSAILAASNPSNFACQWFCRTGRWRRSKTSHLLDCGPWARKGRKVFCYRDSEGAFGHRKCDHERFVLEQN